MRRPPGLISEGAGSCSGFRLRTGLDDQSAAPCYVGTVNGYGSQWHTEGILSGSPGKPSRAHLAMTFWFSDFCGADGH